MEALLARKKKAVFFMLIGYAIAFGLFMMGALSGGISSAIFTEEMNIFDSFAIIVILIGVVVYLLTGPVALIVALVEYFKTKKYVNTYCVQE